MQKGLFRQDTEGRGDTFQTVARAEEEKKSMGGKIIKSVLGERGKFWGGKTNKIGLKTE